MRIYGILILVGWVFFGVACGSEVGGDDEDNDWEFCEEEPQCQDEWMEVSSCLEGYGCEKVEACGEEIWCELVHVSCPLLECPPEATEVDGPEDCPQGDVNCYRVEEEACGQEIWCYEQEQLCEAVPVCLQGANEGECPDGADVHCWEVTECGTTITCWEYVDQCLAMPVCPNWANEGECPDEEGVVCWEETMCGMTITCYDYVVNCDAIPVCPQGSEEVQECPEDDQYPCWEEEMCGTVIYCAEYQP